MRIAVIGAGAWGTALASLWSSKGDTVTIWARDQVTVAAINATHRNPRLPGIALPPDLHATTELADMSGADTVVLAVPAQATDEVARALGPHLKTDVPLVLCAKGIDQTSARFLSDIVGTALPGHPVAALSGPSFAADVARGLPTAVTLAAAVPDLAEALARDLSAPHVRIYASTDLVGVEIGGAVKNVLAIACGISDGLGLGASAKAALIARGFAEMSRFAAAHGGQPDTLSGLSGLGDLVLTCTSPQSRNMALGLRLGEGRSLSEALSVSAGVAEGVATAAVLARLAKAKGIDMPITFAVDQVLAGGIAVGEAVQSLLSRPLPARE